MSTTDPIEILIATDYRGAFLSTHRSRRGDLTMDVKRIAKFFSSQGIDAQVAKFQELYDRAKSNQIVIYTSSEDPSLKYKSYIEDIVYSIESKGIKVLPRFELLRSHHNKAMMEFLRMRYFPEEAAALDTRIFGTYEEAMAQLPDDLGMVVIKAAHGAGSLGVALADGKRAALAKIRPIAFSGDPLAFRARERVKRCFRRGWQPRSLHRSKFIVQNFVPDLQGDCKILNFHGHYYVLYRENRPGDFRASGSGRFSYAIPEHIPLEGLLDYAESVSLKLDTPTLSLDIAFDGTKFHLIEFQALHFGTVTAELSNYYWQRGERGGWIRKEEKCDIEAVYTRAVSLYIQNRGIGGRDFHCD